MKYSLTFVVSFCLCFFWANCALLGVDFGTEYTKAILVAPGVPFDILLTSESKRKDVSGLALLMDLGKDGKKEFHRKYGTQALSTCIKVPQSCMLYLKPLLGHSHADETMREYAEKFPGIGLGIQSGRDAVTVITADKLSKHNETFLLEEVVAMTFLEIKNRALEYWKERSPETVSSIDEVVISVPRYFSEAARIALIDAAELAGLKVVALVDDGLAVAIDYAQKRNDFTENEKEYHLIFDAGAGATKASLVSLVNSNNTLSLELENYGFSNQLNGELFTVTVKAIILNQFSEKNGIPIADVLSDVRAMQKVWQAAEKAKLILSANTETSVNIESFYKEVDFKGVITRAELEEHMKYPLEAVPQMLDKVFTGFDLKNLKSVILTGGSVRVPIVQQNLIDYFGSDDLLSKNVNADESVVFGTTLEGAQILQLTRKKQFKVIDRSSINYDIHYTSVSDSSALDGVIHVPQGTSSQEKFSFNLTEFADRFLPSIDVEVLEDGESLIQKYSFAMPKRFNKTTCEGGLEYVLSYGFSQSDIFQINNLKVNCYPVVNGTVSNVAKVGSMYSESTFYGFQPMPPQMKSKSIARLNAFERTDQERQKMSDVRNKLEAKLYEIRSMLEENEDILPAELLESFSKDVTDTLDWLDYDSDDASLLDVRNRIGEASKVQSKIRLYESVSSYNGALENVNLPYQALLAKKSDILKKIDEILNKDTELAEECKRYDIDYEKKIKKVYGTTWPPLESSLEEIETGLSVLDKTVAVLEQGAESFGSMGIDVLVEAVQKVKKVEKLLMTLDKGYEEALESRKEFVNHLLISAKKAAKKAEKEKLKEQEKAETVTATTTETTTTTVEETGELTETYKTSTSSTTDVSHDEL